MNDAQERAPIHEALLEYSGRGITALHTPGHRGREMAPGLETLLTSRGLACDLPSLDATDSTFHPEGCVAEAQQLAAELAGAAATHYLVHGSSAGVHTMLLATLSPGDEVLLSRHHHLSVFAGLVLCGAVPRYLPPRWSSAAGPVPPTADDVEAGLRAHPGVRAVFLTHPTYYGVGRSLAPIAEVCRARAIPLLVDEAHGAHLRFLPAGNLSSALDEGADLVVQSPHKTLGSLVGTAQLHVGHGALVERARVQAMLNLLQTTSPSYLLLASLDLTRREMARRGRARFAEATSRALDLRESLAALPGVEPLVVARHQDLAGCVTDPLRLVVDVRGLGATGFEVERRLRAEARVYGELADATNVAYVLGPADEPGAAARLCAGLSRLSADRPRGAREEREEPLAALSISLPPLVLTPREAASRRTRRVSLADAVGEVSGETIAVYPPGIPLVCPGERLTGALVEECRRLRELRAPVSAMDAALETITVLAGEPFGARAKEVRS